MNTLWEKLPSANSKLQVEALILVFVLLHGLIIKIRNACFAKKKKKLAELDLNMPLVCPRLFEMFLIIVCVFCKHFHNAFFLTGHKIIIIFLILSTLTLFFYDFGSDYKLACVQRTLFELLIFTLEFYVRCVLGVFSFLPRFFAQFFWHTAKNLQLIFGFLLNGWLNYLFTFISTVVGVFYIVTLRYTVKMYCWCASDF